MLKSRSGFLFFRLLKWFISVIFLIGITIPVAFVIFFDPNDYKQNLTELLAEKTHLPLQFEGSLQVHYFPWLGFTAHQITLPQPGNFGSDNFVTIQSLQCQMPLTALLKGQLRIDHIVIDGMALRLRENRNGHKNWVTIQEALQTAHAPKSSTVSSKADSQLPKNTVTTASKKTKKSKRKLMISLSEITWKNATVSYDNAHLSQQFTLNDLNLNIIEDATPQHFKVALECRPQGNFSNEFGPLNGHIKMQGITSLDNGPHIKGDITGTLHNTTLPKDWQKGSFKATVDANTERLRVDELMLQTNTQTTGSLTIPWEPKQPITFKIAIQALNLDDWLPQPTTTALMMPEQSETTSAYIIPVSATSDYMPAEPMISQRIKGEVQIGSLYYQSHHLSKIKAVVLKTDDTLSLSPVVAQLYDGKLQATITHKLNVPQATTQCNGQYTHFNIAALLAGFKQPALLEGTGALNFKLQYSPTAPLIGTVKCQINQGAVEGLDVFYLLKKAGALLKGDKTDKLKNSKKTPFNALTATLKIHDNQVDNNDLLVDGPDFTANGEGRIDLAQETIAYKLKVMRVYHDGKAHPNALPLAIRIKGPLHHPSIEPDLDVYLKAHVSKAVSSEVEDQIKRQINKFLPEKSESDPSETADEPAKNSLEEIIDKNIQKGLRKLFK